MKPFISKKNLRYHLLAFRKHDLRASGTVFFVALPLCLGISLASGAPVYSGLLAGILGGIIVAPLSGSQLSVSGPAAGLTAICAAVIATSGLDVFFISVAVAGVMQVLLGVFRLGGFTHFIPSTVIKGMLAAIGIILISKQIPALIGYDKPDFWSNELFNIFTLRHVFSNVQSLYESITIGAILVAALSLIMLRVWKLKVQKHVPFLPTSFVTVLFGVLLAMALGQFFPSMGLNATQFVQIPDNIFSTVRLPDFGLVTAHAEIWKNGLVICFVATLETLLSIEAIDKLDAQNRITPQNRELVAQGTGNLLSGLLGGLPITAVIVRSSANAEAGAKTWLSGFTHGVWLLLAVLLATNLVNLIPYCVLAAILIRTGYNLAKPSMFLAVWRQGREQFLPFIVTIVAVLVTDLLIGVLIGVAYSIYFLIKHTYRAGFVVREHMEGHIPHYYVELALNVSFLNKKRLSNLLDKVPDYSVVEIIGTDSVYIDHDILEIFQQYKSKAHNKHIQLVLKDIPEVQTISLH
jgi:MFS superfamily sulfate permease-like transporter